jgi:spore coat polysaccharide biosynthesis protein SpsF (cytidylyltransferase family)
MKIGVIILARANFGRWPDKVLYKLQGKTLLEHVIRKSKQLDVDTIIVSTTDSQEDQIIRDIAWDAGAFISRGEPEDRTARINKAIRENKLDYILNISPAAPFMDVELTNKVIAAFRENPGYDFYRPGGYTWSFVWWVVKSTVIFKQFERADRDQELYSDPTAAHKVFSLYDWHGPELRNRFLFDGNIAYRIQADNHRRICEYLGHFPENYDEVVEALMGIG